MGATPPWRRSANSRDEVGWGTYAIECERQARRYQRSEMEDDAAREWTTPPWRRGRPSSSASGGAEVGQLRRDTSTSVMSAAPGSREHIDELWDDSARCGPPTPTRKPRPPSFQTSGGTPEKPRRPSQPETPQTMHGLEEAVEEEMAESDEVLDADAAEMARAQDEWAANLHRGAMGSEDCPDGEASEEERPMVEDPPLDDPDSEAVERTEYVEVELDPSSEDPGDTASDHASLVQQGPPAPQARTANTGPQQSKPLTLRAAQDIVSGSTEAIRAREYHPLNMIPDTPDEPGSIGGARASHNGQSRTAQGDTPKDHKYLTTVAAQAREQYAREEEDTQAMWESYQEHALEEQDLLEAVREWEQELAEQARSTHCAAGLHLMQQSAATVAVRDESNALTKELSRLQQCLEGFPLTTQATRERMLEHRVRERYGGHKVPEEAQPMLALVAVYQEGVPTHKLQPRDDDFDWVRSAWRDIARLMPNKPEDESQAVLVEETQVMDATEPRQNFTSIKFQKERDAEIIKAHALREQELQDMQEALQQPASSSAERRPAKKLKLVLQTASLSVGGQDAHEVEVQAGQTIQVKMTLSVEDAKVEANNTADHVAGVASNAGSTPGPVQKDQHAAVRETAMEEPEEEVTEDEALAYDPDSPSPPPRTTDKSSRPVIVAPSALPPTVPKNPHQRNLHHISELRPATLFEPEREPERLAELPTTTTSTTTTGVTVPSTTAQPSRCRSHHSQCRQ